MARVPKPLTADQLLPRSDGFWSRVDRASSDACWLWLGQLNAQGYGVYNTTIVSPSPLYAHRISYALHYGRLPSGWTVDHLCRTPRCVNPTHLELVTLEENSRRGAASRARSHCPEGHEYDYVIIRSNGTLNRQCRTCRRERMREFSVRNVERRRRMRREAAAARGGWKGL